jgi:hypothetical protein
MRQRIRSARLGALIAAGLALSAGGGLGVWAALRATVTNAADSATSGTVELTDNDGGQVLFNLSNLKPGDTATQCMRVSYTGTLPAKVRLYGATSGTGLEGDVAVRITRGTMASDPGPRSCTGFAADSTTWVTGANAGDIYVGALKDFPGSYAAGLGDPTTASPATWTNGTIRAYRIQLAVGDNRSYEGKNATQSFTWEAHDTSGYSGSVLGTSGLVSYWRLGETSGTAASDSRGSNNGTYTGGFTLNQGGALTGDSNPSVAVNGSTGYVNVPNASNLSPSSALSVEAWVYPTVGTSTQRWVSKFNQYTLRLMSTQKAQLELGIGAGFPSVTDSSNLSLNTWHHVVGTYDGATMKLYVDGSQKASAAQTGAVTQSSNALTLSSLSGSSEFFNGRLDEVAIYNRALSATEVQTHYTAGQGN